MVRDATQSAGEKTAITRPSDVLPWLDDIRRSDREHFVCFHLNARNVVLSMETVSIGTLNASLVHPRETLKAAILNNAASIIIAHNHPSGDVAPSSDDIKLTAQMMKACDIVGIGILDHIIVGPERHLSMKEAGFM
jgi:DNA repair protein RadC